jgi:hypothetical protein
VRIVLTPEQLAQIAAESTELLRDNQILAAAVFDRDAMVCVVLIAPAERLRAEIEASLELTIAAVVALGRLHFERTRSAYWRERVAKVSIEDTDKSKALDEIRRMNRLADDATRALLDAPAESRIARLVEVVAASASFEDWIVARKRADQFVILAAARRKSGDSVRSGILAEALMARRIIVRDTPDLSLFPRRCVAIAIEDLVLAFSPLPESDAVAPIPELLATRLAPVVRL